MVRRIGGDGFPPDSNVEKESLPKVGQIWREDFEKNSEPGFFRVMKVEEKEVSGENKIFIYIRRYSPDTGRVTGRAKEIKEAPLIFSKKYQLVAENEEEFSARFPLSSLDRPVKPISAFEELGEPWEPIKEDKNPDEELSGEELVLGPEQEEDGLEGDIPEPVNPESRPEGLPVTPEPAAELTPEQKKRAELGERLGLTVEQLTEREVLEKAVDEARGDYVTSLYEHEQKLLRVLSILNLKRNPDPDPQYKEVYDQALKNLQQFDSAHLQGHLENATLAKEAQDASVKSYTERYSRLEAVALWSEQQEIRAKFQQDGLEQLGDLSKKVIEKVNFLADEYKKLSWKKKLAIGGGLLGLHAGIAFVSAPAAIGAASFWFGAKIVTGTAAYKSTSKFAETGAHWLGDKVANRKDTRDLKNLKRASLEEMDLQPDAYLKKLNEVALKNIEGLDKKLAAYERNGLLVKGASLALIFGVPAGRYIGDLAGAGAEAVSVSGTVDKDTLLPINDVPEGKIEGGVAPETAPDSVLKPPEQVPGTLTVEGAGGASAGVEAGATAPAFETVTVAKGDNLWNLVQRQLPDNITDEAEKNRITASIQNSIQNKLNGLTDAEITGKYGFSGKNISLIKEGQVIKLDALVSKEELQEIINGKTVLQVNITETPGAEVPAPDKVLPGAQVAMPDAEAAAPTPEARRPVGIGFKDTPRSERDQYWRGIQAGQGNYRDSVPGYYDNGYAERSGLLQDAAYDPEAPEGSEVQSEVSTQPYTYEESRLQSLTREQIPLAKESMNLLQEELFHIEGTEFGPDYRPGKWKSEELWNLYKERGVQDLIATDNPRFERDIRDSFRARQELRISRRLRLPSMEPYPRLENGPDVYANHTADKIEQGYRNNLRDMAYAAMEKWGSVALPQGRNESVREYMNRITTLYTRARLENPDFRLKF